MASPSPSERSRPISSPHRAYVLRTGGCAALGVATADGLYALVAALGGAALAAALQPVLAPLRWASVLVLLAMAVRGAVGAVRQYREQRLAARSVRDPVRPARAYLTLLGITLLNPTTVIYFAALVLGSRTAEAVRPWSRGVRARRVRRVRELATPARRRRCAARPGADGTTGRLVTALASSAVIVVLAVRMLVAP